MATCVHYIAQIYTNLSGRKERIKEDGNSHAEQNERASHFNLNTSSFPGLVVLLILQAEQ